MPDFPHRRKAIIDFIRNVPADQAQRNGALRFLDRVAKTDNPVSAAAVLEWVHRMGLDEGERDRYLSARHWSPAGRSPTGQSDAALVLRGVHTGLPVLPR